ncbi:hypothetical protein ACHAP5_010655 [Fusarium lateritium]
MYSTDPVERLPPEIFDEILGFLWGEHLSCECPPKSLNAFSPLATVSRKWKRLIERLTFRDLELTQRRVSEALEGKYYASEGLSNIRFVWLDLTHAFCTDADTDKPDRQVVESYFNKSIHQIFEFLKHLPRLETPHVQLITVPDEICGEYCEVPDTGFLELDTNWGNLPELPMVLHFGCNFNDRTGLSPSAYCRLASKMPRLNEVGWLMQDRLDKRRSVQVKDRSSESFAINHP